MTNTSNCKLVILYRSKLKMSVGKIAAQAVHAASVLKVDPMMTVIVLGVTETRFKKSKPTAAVVIQDAGFTEVPEGTVTCLAYFESLSGKQIRKRWGRNLSKAFADAKTSIFNHTAEKL